MLTKDQQLLNDIAFALNDHTAAETGAAHFVDLTTGEVSFVPAEYMLEKDGITEDEIAKYMDWEQDQIRTYYKHEFIKIVNIPSHESFCVMKAFADTRPSHEQNRLYEVLQGQHPFADFRHACIELGILKQWYDFQNDAQTHQAQAWLTEHRLEIKDGKIVRITE